MKDQIKQLAILIVATFLGWTVAWLRWKQTSELMPFPTFCVVQLVVTYLGCALLGLEKKRLMIISLIFLLAAIFSAFMENTFFYPIVRMGDERLFDFLLPKEIWLGILMSVTCLIDYLLNKKKELVIVYVGCYLFIVLILFKYF